MGEEGKRGKRGGAPDEDEALFSLDECVETRSSLPTSLHLSLCVLLCFSPCVYPHLMARVKLSWEAWASGVLMSRAAAMVRRTAGSSIVFYLVEQSEQKKKEGRKQ